MHTHVKIATRDSFLMYARRIQTDSYRSQIPSRIGTSSRSGVQHPFSRRLNCFRTWLYLRSMAHISRVTDGIPVGSTWNSCSCKVRHRECNHGEMPDEWRMVCIVKERSIPCRRLGLWSAYLCLVLHGRISVVISPCDTSAVKMNILGSLHVG